MDVNENGYLSFICIFIWFLFRNENNKYFLDVYSPEKLWNSGGNIKRITNPVCIIEDGNPLIDNVCLLHQDKVLSWTSENSTVGNTVQYSISKIVFRIISENEGYITCRAFVAETMDEIVTKKQLFRWVMPRNFWELLIMWDIHEDKVLELVMTETFVLSINSIGEYQIHTWSPPELCGTQTFMSHDKLVHVTTAWCILRLWMKEWPPIWTVAANIPNR